MRSLRYLLWLAVVLSVVSRGVRAQAVEIRLDPSIAAQPVTGRIFVFFSKTDSREPRLLGGSYGGSVPFFGADIDAWTPQRPAVIDRSTLGYPYGSLAQVPAGEYFVQALLNVYTRFERADGHIVWAHNDQWEGQRFNVSPGNLVSDVRKVRFDPASKTPLRLTLTRVLPAVSIPPDTRWVKRIRMKSEMLSRFWGRDMYIGATVLLPKGFDDEPTRRYPAIYVQGHFGLGAPFGFTEEAGSETPAQKAARLQRGAREPGWEFARDWQRDDFPRMVAITWQHPTPYYDDSYAVNSVNNGPYQDALLTELVPVLEKQFRLLPESGARFLTGGSTGGWECAALQIQRPDFFGGAWCLYPDPVDFRRNQLTDNYADTNAFVPNGNTPPVPERYMMRTAEGQPQVTTRQMSQLEAVLGSHARSGQQFDAWDAAYGPIGRDGYPVRLWDRLTGTIDKTAAAYWRDNGYDLTWYMVKNWPKIGPSLSGKIRMYTGDMDNHYLNLAVYLMEEESSKLTNPKANFVFEYGRPMKPHGWQPMTNAELVRMMDKVHREHRVQP
ncbi:MAG: hypothetical protein MNPFHGCM_00516 [Gemmatimonadaceae bacterium]|nr:hypothetical protein [Gemmatimonadaceae bacterium]